MSFKKSNILEKFIQTIQKQINVKRDNSSYGHTQYVRTYNLLFEIC